MMTSFRIRNFMPFLAVLFCMSVPAPAFAIQNIGFPDDQAPLLLESSDAKSFQASQKAMQDALSTLIVVGDIKGESKRYAKEFKSIASGAETIETIALQSGNKAIAEFMSTIKSWSTSGDADDIAPELIKKINDYIVGIKVTVK